MEKSGDKQKGGTEEQILFIQKRIGAMTEHYIYKQYICHNHDEQEGQE